MTACSFFLVDYFFFFNDTATTEIYTLSLHDALPIFTFAEDEVTLKPVELAAAELAEEATLNATVRVKLALEQGPARSEEHTSELQSRQYLVCRLLLEKKKKSSKKALPTEKNQIEVKI